MRSAGLHGGWPGSTGGWSCSVDGQDEPVSQRQEASQLGSRLVTLPGMGGQRLHSRCGPGGVDGTTADRSTSAGAAGVNGPAVPVNVPVAAPYCRMKVAVSVAKDVVWRL